MSNGTNPKPVILSTEERELIYWSLQARMGIIETGVAHVRAADVAKIGVEYADQIGARLRPLDTDQMRTIVALEALAYRML